MRGLQDGVAVVTGGASGIGAAVVRAFVAAGSWTVIADVSEAAGAALAKELGDRCRFIRIDLREDSDVERLVSDVAGWHGRLDFIVCTACTYQDQGADSDRLTWRNGFDVNLFGHVLLVQRAREYLRQSKRASVVNFSSGSAHFALSGRWVYPATKAAIEQVTRSQAMDLAEDSIRVNAVQPAWTAKGAPPEDLQARERYEGLVKRFHMLGRAGKANEIADAVLFLCSEHAGFMTGTCLRVDGGHSSMGPQGRERILPTTLRANPK